MRAKLRWVQSSLFKLVMQDQPSLKTQRSEREWVGIFDRVLHVGEVGRRSGVFGKVESRGTVCAFFFLFVFSYRLFLRFFVLALAHVLTECFTFAEQRESPLGSLEVLCPNWMRLRSERR